MNEQLLMGLLEEYQRLLAAERNFRGIEKSLQNRPTKAEINRVGLMIRQETLKYEKEFGRNYWGFR